MKVFTDQLAKEMAEVISCHVRSTEGMKIEDVGTYLVKALDDELTGVIGEDAFRKMEAELKLLREKVEFYEEDTNLVAEFGEHQQAEAKSAFQVMHYEQLARKLHTAWRAWLKDPEIGPSEEMLDCMGAICDKAQCGDLEPEDKTEDDIDF